MRIFMEKLGEQQFGIWMWVNTIIASLSFVNIGFGDATLKYVAEYRSKGQMSRAAKVINGTLSVYGAIGLGLAFSCFVAAEAISYFNLHRAIGIEDANKQLSIIVFQIGALTFSLRLVEQIVLSALKGLERYDASARLSILSKTVVLILNVWMVQQGFALVQIFLNSAVVTALGLVVEVLWLKRYVPQLSLIPTFNNPELKKVSGYGFWAWLGSIIHIFSSQMDKYIVTVLAGVNIFGYYSAAATMGERALGVTAAAAGFLFPIISARVSKNEPTLKLFYKSQTVMIAGGMLGGLVAIWFQEPIFGFILKEKYAATAPYLHAYLLYFGTLTCTVIPFYFLMGSGLVKYGTFVRLAIIGFQLILVPGAYYWMGPALMPIGLTLAHYLGSIIYSYIMAKHVYRTPPLRFSLEQAVLPGLFLVCMYFNYPLFFLALGGVAWKLIYFDRISFVFMR